KKIHNGNNAKIITVVASGSPEEAFPKELCSELVEVVDDEGNVTYEERIIEPLAANVASDNTKEAIKKLKGEILRVVAPMLGCGYDDLYNREQKKKVRTLVTAGTGILSVLLAFLIYNSAMLYKINTQKVALEEANRDLQIKNSEVYVSQAESCKEAGDIYSAVKYAYEAIPEEGEDYPAAMRAQRIISGALGIYENKEIQSNTSVKISGYVDYIKPSEDGNRLLAKDNNGKIYIIDTDKKEIIKALTPYEALGTTSNYLNDIEVAGNFGYISGGNKIISIKLSDGSINWKNENSDCSDIVVSSGSDAVCGIGYSGYFFMDKETGKIVSEGSFEKSSNYLKEYTYMSQEGKIYSATGDGIEIASKDSLASASLGIGKDDEVLSMGENEKYVYVNIGRDSEDSFSFNKAELVCIDKKTDTVKWKTSYNVKGVYGGSGEILPLTHRMYADEKKEELLTVNGMVVPLDNGIYYFEQETGEHYASIEDIEEVVTITPHNEYMGIRVIAENKFADYILIMSKGTNNYGWVSGYMDVSDAKYAAFFGNNFAIAKENSSEIIISEKILSDNRVIYDGFTTEKNPDIIKEADNGTIVCAESGYGSDEVIKTVIGVYDGEKIKATMTLENFDIAEMLLSKECIVVIGRENAILYDFEGNKLDEIEFEDYFRKNIGVAEDKFFYFTYKAASVNGDKLLLCSSDGCGTLDIADKKFTYESYEDFGSVREFSENEGAIAFVANEYVSGNETFKIACVSEDGFYYVKSGNEDYIYEDDTISCISYIREKEIIAFNDKAGFIGIFKNGEADFSKIEYDVNNNTIYSLALTKDGKWLFALCADGRIIKYSTETLEEISVCDTRLTIRDSAELKTINEKELVLDNYAASAIISAETNEIKADIGIFNGISADGSKLYTTEYILGENNISNYKIGYYENLDKKGLLEKAKEFLGIE
ncbi:MAG: hypothetical protein Q4G23_10035, partial [Clostridia bacterium]|nr:hypothetical protein [Clostridia bacterium]